MCRDHLSNRLLVTIWSVAMISSAKKNIKLWVRAVQVRIFLFVFTTLLYITYFVMSIFFLRFFLYYNCSIKKHKIPLKAFNGAVISGISPWQFTTKLHQNITIHYRTYVQNTIKYSILKVINKYIHIYILYLI